MSHPTENQEWQDELLDSWVEIYKKAMTTPILLRLIAAHRPVTTSALAALVPESTGRTLTERGLYRTLKRIEAQGLIAHSDSPAPRTGALRKNYHLTPLGQQHLTAIEGHLNRVNPPAANSPQNPAI